MRDVAIVSFANHITSHAEGDDVEMLVPVITEALRAANLKKKEIGFTVSGSCDYLGGRPFSFVMALDAVGAWPPIEESHVEMDGAFALYEAWVRLQHGDIDTALIYAFGRSTTGSTRDVLATQLDPYVMAPLWPDSVGLAALQARAMLDAGTCTEREMAQVAARSRRSKKPGPGAHTFAEMQAGDLLGLPYTTAPLRAHDCAPDSDGVAAMVLVAGDRAKKLTSRPAWIRGIDHRIEAHQLGVRDLTKSVSTALAAEKAGALGKSFDVAEIHAPFSHQEILVRKALGLAGDVEINPSGGALVGNPYIVAGLDRIGEAARRIHDGSAKSAVAHATSGPCLQQNLVCVLSEG